MSKKKTSEQQSDHHEHSQPVQENEKEHTPVPNETGQNTALASCQEQLMRIQADFENFKKRLHKERKSWIIQAKSDLLREVLSFVDDFDRAIKTKQEKDDPWFQGLCLAHKNLHDTLSRLDVEEIDCSDAFNPELHSALAEVSSDKHPSGHIVEVVAKGYLFRGDVLRHAQVTVAK